MITVEGAEKLSVQMQQFSKDARRKLEHMVSRFASDVVQAASTNTPVGDADSLVNNTAYAGLYEYRARTYGIPEQVGYHKGSWVAQEVSDIEFDPSIQSTASAVSAAYARMQASYRLGDTFYIGSSGPGIVQLEQGYSKQAPAGISKPTLQMVLQAYKADLSRYYREG